MHLESLWNSVCAFSGWYGLRFCGKNVCMLGKIETFLGLDRTIYTRNIYGVYTVIWAGKSANLRSNICIYTVLANPTNNYPLSCSEYRAWVSHWVLCLSFAENRAWVCPLACSEYCAMHCASHSSTSAKYEWWFHLHNSHVALASAKNGLQAWPARLLFLCTSHGQLLLLLCAKCICIPTCKFQVDMAPT